MRMERSHKSMRMELKFLVKILELLLMKMTTQRIMQFFIPTEQILLTILMEAMLSQNSMIRANLKILGLAEDFSNLRTPVILSGIL